MAKPNLRAPTGGRRAGDRVSHAQMRQLSATLQAVREQERAHLARELHDDTGQLLTLLRMDVAGLLRAAGLAAETRRVLEGMDQRIVAALASLRRVAASLRPRALDEQGLYCALRSLCREFGEHQGARCELRADEHALQFNGPLGATVFRIVQEALTNIARHAQARVVHVSVGCSGDALLLTITDDGCGIGHALRGKRGTLGLTGMRERVWALQGEISIGAHAPHGTRIDVSLPLP